MRFYGRRTVKKIRVTVESKNKLVLDEDAQKGDFIDLSDINSVDTSSLEAALSKGADKIYLEKLKQAKIEFELERQKEKADLQAQIEKVRTQSVSDSQKERHELEIALNKQIADLQMKLSSFEEAKKSAITEITAKKDSEIAELKQKIIAAFGTEAYDENGCYNRKWIAEQVFCNDEKLSLLNSLIHPAVKEDFEKWLAQQKTKTAFKETALLFELGLNEECWKTILITAEENQRIKRVMDRDGRTYRQVKEIIDKQMPETEKIKLADFIIINNGNLENLTAEIREVLAKIETL